MVMVSEGEIGLLSTLDHKLKPQALHWLEVITGTGRRRRFSDDDKTRIIEETLVPGAVVSDCAPSWVIAATVVRLATSSTAACLGEHRDVRPLFVPALVEATLPERAVRRRGHNRPLDEYRVAGIIEIEIGSVTVRVGGRSRW